MWWNQKLRIRTIEYSRIRRFKSVACISHSLSIIRAPLVPNRMLNVAGSSAPILHVDTDTGDMSAPAEPVRRISRFKGHVPTSNDQESGHGITMTSPGHELPFWPTAFAQFLSGSAAKESRHFPEPSTSGACLMPPATLSANETVPRKLCQRGLADTDFFPVIPACT